MTCLDINSQNRAQQELQITSQKHHTSTRHILDENVVNQVAYRVTRFASFGLPKPVS